MEVRKHTKTASRKETVRKVTNIKKNLHYLKLQHWIKSAKALHTLAWKVKHQKNRSMIVSIRESKNNMQVGTKEPSN